MMAGDPVVVVFIQVSTVKFPVPKLPNAFPQSTKSSAPSKFNALAAGEQLSVAVALNGTVAVQALATEFTSTVLRQFITGPSVSFTVTVKEQVAVLPLPSVAKSCTDVVPDGNTEPEAGPETVLKVTSEQTPTTFAL